MGNGGASFLACEDERFAYGGGAMKRMQLLAAGTAALMAMTTMAGTAGPTATASETSPPTNTGTTTAPAPGAAPRSIDWGRCGDRFLRRAGGRCGFVAVPLDYDDPEGRKIRIAVSRIRHTSRTSQGVMLVNPGGPGASGLGLAQIGRFMPRRSGAGYDWIGFAPRGVKPGQPALSCTWDFRAPNLPFVPANAAQIRAWLRIARLEARGCSGNGALLDNMRTTDHARDLDEIRKALGVEQINYYGYSYGSYFGQVYATLFPSRVRRMVLDSNVDPTETWYAADREVTLAAERVLETFFAWTARHHGTYRLGRSGRTVKELYLAERRALRRSPVAGGFGPNEWDIAFSVVGYSQSVWPLLAEAFAIWVRDDNPRPLIRALRLLALRLTPNEAAAFLSTACTDSPWPTSAQRLVSDARRLHKRAPINAWPITWGTAACVYWPAEDGPLFDVPGNGVRMLLVGQTLEAATPFDDSLTVRSIFPESRLVAIRDGTTHGSSPFESGTCANARIAAYLKRGVLPPRRAGSGADVVCAAPPPPRPVRPVPSSRAARFLLGTLSMVADTPSGGGRR